MKILKGYPPNYLIIKAAMPYIENGKPIFCYGDTIYNPHRINVTPDLEIHEKVHSKQQGDNPSSWWIRYLQEPEFRLGQEIEAYGVQYRAIKGKIPHKFERYGLEQMALALSGDMYGNIISYGEAESKIRNYAKNL